jgi:hypothetical protein
MANYCYTVPILPGRVELMKKWIAERIVDNREHDELFAEAGISREQVWVQHTPMGDFAVVSFEVKDAEKAFEVLATSKKPFAVDFRAFLTEAHGVDFSQPFAINEQVADWHAK